MLDNVKATVKMTPVAPIVSLLEAIVAELVITLATKLVRATLVLYSFVVPAELAKVTDISVTPVVEKGLLNRLYLTRKLERVVEDVERVITTELVAGSHPVTDREVVVYKFMISKSYS